jgi:hypothetical protein
MLNERDPSMSRVGLSLIRYGRCEDAGAQRLKLKPKIEPDTQISYRGKEDHFDETNKETEPR